jgi:hypothetical protein
MISVFDPKAYGEKVSEILSLDGGGQRLMPLAEGTRSSAEAYRLLQATNARDLFPNARAPEAALAGLYLYFSCLDEAHNISQEIETPDGSFWHGIIHRQEPDAGNSGYWFRQVGKHPIFPELKDAAAELGYDWEPFRFIEDCDEERRRPGTGRELLLKKVQRAEWQLLFDHCARAR